MTKGERNKDRERNKDMGEREKQRETKIVKKGKKHKDILTYDIGGEI